MITALIDNGSLEADAHRNLRRVARELSQQTGFTVHAVSWRHSDRIPVDSLNGIPALTLAPWILSQVQQGGRDFVFVPFFISPQGAIGSALHNDLEGLSREAGGFDFQFTAGLAERDVIVRIVVDRIRETIAEQALGRPAVIVVDHGGPSKASADVRDQLVAKIRSELGPAVARVSAASLEGAKYIHTRPLLSEQLGSPGYDHGPVVIAPLFLSPGRHAGPDGDLAQIARAAQVQPGRQVSYHFTGLVGTHPLASLALSSALSERMRRRDPAPAR